ncbi:DUF2069 domain-containing protein [Arenimonas donghaensis]|uniref:DUF2069 domain-containing protein n=1 Tax=Arenimonas donghaensis DSM 18148 = HO3-R19 TaxID=1121014 RepID=A0A087MJW1_9GAMM|nr:DUF2069 domain-containing protein [Arenimonas donghaensis]KFL37164.1 hypothetical protein N788_10785 [Arenimonas donghaensis DSM 18148 = HO3-R19]
MTRAAKITAACTLALFALHLAWRLWLVPPTQAAPWMLALWFSLPILPAVVLVLMRHRRTGFWAAMAALLYFCHGVMLAWSAPDVRTLALVEAALSAVLVLAASWDGMRARFASRRAGKPAV